MADKEDNFDIEKDLPNFCLAVTDRAESLLQGTLDPEAIVADVKVLDLTVGLIRSIRESYNLENSNKENLDSLADAFTDVLRLLLHRSTITPSSVLL